MVRLTFQSTHRSATSTIVEIKLELRLVFVVNKFESCKLITQIGKNLKQIDYLVAKRFFATSPTISPAK